MGRARGWRCFRLTTGERTVTIGNLLGKTDMDEFNADRFLPVPGKHDTKSQRQNAPRSTEKRPFSSHFP